ncbi:hypothetical protein BDZ89DRAFT_1177596 [Hymenopellis radicata]|nr:hypothetical protein BDZ89DRAFT_1177596 [Hymenopellis radicata]
MPPLASQDTAVPRRQDDRSARDSYDLPAPPHGNMSALETHDWLATLGARTESLRDSLLDSHPALGLALQKRPGHAADASDQDSTTVKEEPLPAKSEERHDELDVKGEEDSEEELAGSMDEDAHLNSVALPDARHYRVNDPNVWHRDEISHYTRAWNLEGDYSRRWDELVGTCADLWYFERRDGNLIDAPRLCDNCHPELVVVHKVNGKVPPQPTKPDAPKDSAHCWFKPGMADASCFQVSLPDSWQTVLAQNQGLEPKQVARSSVRSWR